MLAARRGDHRRGAGAAGERVAVAALRHLALVEDSIARLAGGGSIAGSTLTMDGALRRAVQVLGVPIVDAARAAATTPARVLGLRTGALEPGLDADLVVLDDELAVSSVMVRGRWASVPPSADPGRARLIRSSSPCSGPAAGPDRDRGAAP